ncbi:Protein CBG06585 [Caenorhabditis briggsae]|uniref:Protein CBG06585 n=1 Tax=Caenorhabditis briggsae TaxID=6238 RepID=A8X2L0_CAEBR|nr:Protein CBG06585 [Caenorhabditis briggsae]CAP26870.2 Protein CBG06585 [Caenorhabditis briggsae]
MRYPSYPISSFLCTTYSLKKESTRKNHQTWVVPITFAMNSIYTAEFDENRAFPVMAYANALCTYIQQLVIIDCFCWKFFKKIWIPMKKMWKRSDICQSAGCIARRIGISKSTVSAIVKRVVEVINKNYDNIRIPSKPEDWRDIKETFVRRGLLKCIGAIDGKHVRVKAPPNSGSLFFNFKKFFSFAPLGLVRANLRFRFVDIALDHTDDVAKICINIKKSHEYFLRKSMKTSQANSKKQTEGIPVAEIDDSKAENDRLNTKVRELELEKNTADARIAELVRLVELKSNEASQVAANARIFACRKCEKNRDIDELNEKNEKLENIVRQMSERNTELQISRKSMEALIAEQLKKINEIESTSLCSFCFKSLVICPTKSMELKKDLKLKEELLKHSKISMDHIKANSTELEREIYYFRQKMETKDSEIEKLKENIGVMKTRCNTYAGQLQLATMEVFDLEKELEALSLYVPTHTPEPVANNEQSERDPLLERVKGDNEQLQKDTQEEKANDFNKEINKNHIVMESKENLKNVEDMNM